MTTREQAEEAQGVEAFPVAGDPVEGCDREEAPEVSGTFQFNGRDLEKIVEATVVKIATEVLAVATAIVPQDTGNLGNSLTLAEDPSPEPGVISRVVGTNVFYAPFVEFGTRFSPVPPGRVRHGGQRPFLGAALEQTRRRYGL